MSKQATCKKCGADIKWIQTSPRKKWVPCNPDPIKYNNAPDGSVLLDAEGRGFRVMDACKGVTIDRVGYEAHWTNCPFAKEFRK